MRGACLYITCRVVKALYFYIILFLFIPLTLVKPWLSLPLLQFFVSIFGICKRNIPNINWANGNIGYCRFYGTTIFNKNQLFYEGIFLILCKQSDYLNRFTCFELCVKAGRVCALP